MSTDEFISNFKIEPIYKLAQDVANGVCGEFVYCLQNGNFYEYTQGYWKEIPELKLLSRLEENLVKTVKLKNKKTEEIFEKQVHILTKYAPARKKQILEHLKLIKFKELQDFNKIPLINLENYMLGPEGINVISHNKDYYSTIRVPYKYEALAECPLWIETLEQIFEGDYNRINTLQEFFGYGLTRDTKREKALLLLGESRSGKTTVLNTFQYMVGEENCSHVALANLDNPVYTSMMINKLINIDGEVSKKAEDFEAQFKTIVTGHEVMCNDKFMKPFKFRPFCKFVMSANEFPRITDHSSAFYNRLILIPCNRVFKESEQNIHLRQQLLEELPGILNWAIKGLERLNANNKFSCNELLKQAVKELEEENNPVNSFIDEHIEIELDNYIEKAELFTKYQQWCKDNQQYNLSHIKFAGCIYKRFSKETPKDARLSNNGPRVWKNLKYVNFKTVVKKEEIQWQD